MQQLVSSAKKNETKKISRPYYSKSFNSEPEPEANGGHVGPDIHLGGRAKLGRTESGAQP